MSRAKSIGTWAAIILLAVPVGAAGIGKLMGVEMMHQSFQQMGLPVWFGYFIGLCEFSGAIGLLIPRLSSGAASGLLVIMLGAIGYHISYPPLSAGVPSTILAILAIVIVFVRKKDSIFLSGQPD